MEIRKVKENDIPMIALLEREIFSVPWSEQSFLSERSSPDSLFYLGEEEGALVGFCILHRFGEEGEIYNIAVSPYARGKGYGDRLLRYVLEKGEGLGTQSVFLEVRESNFPARKLYEKNGFVPVGRRKLYYDAPTEDAVLYRRNTGETGR